MPSKARSLGKAVSSGNPLATGVINASDISGLANAVRTAISVTGSGGYDNSTGVITVTGDVTTAKLKRINWFNNE